MTIPRLGSVALFLWAVSCGRGTPPREALPGPVAAPSAPVLVHDVTTGRSLMQTPRDSITQKFFGHEISDPYRFLEDDDSPRVEQWLAAQGRVTEEWLKAVPGYDALRARVEELLIVGDVSRPYVAKTRQGYRYFYTKRSGRQDQPFLLVRDQPFAPDTIVVDPNALSTTGTTSLDYYHPSPDGSRVAYGTSEAGSEWSTLRIRDVDTGRDLPDTIERARNASVCWEPRGDAFYYARYPKRGSVPADEEAYHRRIYRHVIGTASDEDTLVFGEGRAMTDYPTCALSPDGKWLAVTVYQGWSKSELYVASTVKRPLAFEQATAGANHLYSPIVRNDRVFVVTDDGAERLRVLAFDPSQPKRADWKEVIPEHASDVLEDVADVGDELLTVYLHDAASRLERFDLRGRSRGAVELPELGTCHGFSGHHSGSEAFFDFESFSDPRRITRLDLRTGKTETWQSVPAPAKRVPLEVSRAEARSKDGTRVPYFILRAPGGPRPSPTVLYGYGGFNINLTPRYSRATQILIERGGVFVQAVLRGGGEFGSSWHQAGQLANKQNVFDDFIAVAEDLIRTGVAKANGLGAWGRSNGGLLVAAAITQRPDLFRAAVAGVPLTDMLRYHEFLLARLWIPEYGSAENRDQFEFLRAYSPYHHVEPGTPYPAVLLTTAANDTRVHPMHARKMAAALQHATTSGHPVLLRSETEAGHGAGKALHQQIEETTDLLAFFIEELGLSTAKGPGPVEP